MNACSRGHSVILISKTEDAMQPAKPADRFQIPNALRFESGPGGLVRAVISTPAADAELYLQGAHLTGWTPRGQKPVLFLSSKSMFVPGKAIRGGVPIIFPWFGARADGLPGPAHGFARTTEWAMEATELRDDGRVRITLTLSPTEATRALFSGNFQLRYRVTVGPELEMELEARNVGDEPFTYEDALHAYFAIGDVQQVSVSGLAGTTYIDKTDGFKRKTLDSELLRVAKETDQVHLRTTAACVLHDAAWNRRIVIEKSGSASTVVWNPWVEKTKGMPDMAPGEWANMICIETANAADDAVLLLPGASHKLAATVRIP
jgi:glucose-6-phosphate 1-epimerase